MNNEERGDRQSNSSISVNPIDDFIHHSRTNSENQISAFSLVRDALGGNKTVDEIAGTKSHDTAGTVKVLNRSLLYGPLGKAKLVTTLRKRPAN